MGGSKQTTTSQSTSSPWAPAQPALQNIISQAQNLGAQTNLFLPSYSNTTNQAITGLEAAGQQPGAAAQYLPGIVQGAGQGFGQGMGQIASTAAGDYLNGNPYLMQMLDRAGADTANLVNQQFSSAGRYGSGAHSGTLAKEIGNARTAALMQNYNQERANQLNAANTLYGGGFQGAGLAGQLDQANLYDENLLMQAGQMRDQMAMAQKQAPLAALEWQRNQIAPVGAMGGEQSGTSVTRTPANVPGMILGGLTAGLGLFSGNPTMALSGARGAMAGTGMF